MNVQLQGRSAERGSLEGPHRGRTSRKYPCPLEKAPMVDDAIHRFEGQGYRRMQLYVRKKWGFVPKTCWIADRKEVLGFDVQPAWNRGL